MTGFVDIAGPWGQVCIAGPVPDQDGKMIRKNEILEADIEKLAGEHGLTHVEGMAVFVRRSRMSCVRSIYAASFWEKIFRIWNSPTRPTGIRFTGHSLSVSDIVAMNRDGKIRFYFCDSFGFRELENELTLQL